MTFASLLLIDGFKKTVVWAVLQQDIVVCQAHPALVKLGLVLACLFHFNGLLVRIHEFSACGDKYLNYYLGNVIK